jgi:pseudaminic acid cytidylyltransferase
MAVCIIPARGGSKRIPRKNIRDFCGIPMIGWSIKAAKDAGCFFKIVVSTDDPDIARLAVELGAEVPFLRDAALSDDHTPTVPVVADAIARVSLLPDTPVCCLYATAPFVAADDLRTAHDLILQGDKRFVMAVTSFPYPIQRALRRSPDGAVAMMNPALARTRSQDLEEAWHDAGQFYWARADVWTSQGDIFGPGAHGLALPRHRVQDIDTNEDWTRAEYLMRALQAG